jgi:hypothetical protein
MPVTLCFIGLLCPITLCNNKAFTMNVAKSWLGSVARHLDIQAGYSYLIWTSVSPISRESSLPASTDVTGPTD